MKHTVLFAATVLLAVLVASSPAAAQPAPDPQPSGPMKVSQVHNAFVLSPEVKFGRVNGRDGTLTGGTAGILLDDHLFIGMGGYWQANADPGFEFDYGGLVAGWTFKGSGPVDVTLSALLGGGSATPNWMTYAANELPGDVSSFRRYGMGFREWDGRTRFLIAEPELQLFFRITRRFGVAAGVSYRLITGADSMNRDLQGVTGSVAIRFGSR